MYPGNTKPHDENQDHLTKENLSQLPNGNKKERPDLKNWAAHIPIYERRVFIGEPPRDQQRRSGLDVIYGRHFTFVANESARDTAERIYKERKEKAKKEKGNEAVKERAEEEKPEGEKAEEGGKEENVQGIIYSRRHTKSTTETISRIWTLPPEIRAQIWGYLPLSEALSEALKPSGDLILLTSFSGFYENFSEEIWETIGRNGLVLIISSRSCIDSLRKILPMRTEDVEKFISPVSKIALVMTVWTGCDSFTVKPFEMALTSKTYLRRLIVFLNAKRNHYYFFWQGPTQNQDLIFGMDLDFHIQGEVRAELVEALKGLDWWSTMKEVNPMIFHRFRNYHHETEVTIHGLTNELEGELRVPCGEGWVCSIKPIAVRACFIKGTALLHAGEYVTARAILLIANYWLDQHVFPSSSGWGKINITTVQFLESQHDIWLALSQVSSKLGRFSEACEALRLQTLAIKNWKEAVPGINRVGLFHGVRTLAPPSSELSRQVLIELVFTLAQLGEFDEAVQIVLKELEEDPSDEELEGMLEALTLRDFTQDPWYKKRKAPKTPNVSPEDSEQEDPSRHQD